MKFLIVEPPPLPILIPLALKVIITFRKLSSDAVFVVCSQTFTLFRLRKTAVSVEISDTVSVCLCVPVIFYLFNSW